MNRARELHLLLPAALLMSSCASTKPGTHVELVDRTFVSGAAAPGMSQGVACAAAANRAVAAVALRFSQDFEDVGEEVAEAVGAADDDGKVFLEGYAKDAAQSATVQDQKFDPMDHLCQVVVRWTPPVFVKDAVLDYARRLKSGELAATTATNTPAPASGSATPEPVSVAPPAPAVVSAPPPPPVSVAPPVAPVTPRRNPNVCGDALKALRKTLSSSQKAVDELDECRRRTQGDDGVCHRYKLYVEEAAAKERASGEAVSSCLNGSHAAELRSALKASLPGHAAVAVETRADGVLVLWTFSPVEKTAFAVEYSAGALGGRVPLAANQVQWVREQLGL